MCARHGNYLGLLGEEIVHAVRPRPHNLKRPEALQLVKHLPQVTETAFSNVNVLLVRFALQVR